MFGEFREIFRYFRDFRRFRQFRGIDLTKFIHLETAKVKILGTYVSYNEKLENDENYRKHMIKEKLLNVWRMRQLSIEECILIFKPCLFQK